MATRTESDPHQVFKNYFANAKENASLKDFVITHQDFIVQNHRIGVDLHSIWSKRFKTAYHSFCEETGITLSPSVLQGAQPDWGKIAVKLVARPIAELGSNSSTPSTTTTATSVSASSDTAPTVTPEFLDQFKETHKAMISTQKWKLPSGLYLEDLMLEYGLGLSHENACHSFILDLDDPKWLELVTETEDREALVFHKKTPMPAVQPKMAKYLESFVGKSTFEELLGHARNEFFDPKKEFDMDWAQSTIETALRLYAGNFFPLTDQTESDILKRVWVFIDKAFDDLEVNVRSGEMESVSSSERRNLGRGLNERKRHGHKADLLMKTVNAEFGCCEAGKADHGDEGTKEKVEGGLKAPKMMKDMLCSILKTFPQTDQNPEVVGFIISGLKIFTLVMDCPSPYVCRVTKTKPMFFPTRPEDFAVQMGLLITLISQIKQVVIRTLDATKPKLIVSAPIQSALLGVRQLPPCATSPKAKPAKRPRLSQHSSSS